VEVLNFPTSSIQTTTTAVTRTADDVSVQVDGNFISSAEGDHSQFMRYKLLGDVGTNVFLYSSRSSGNVTGKFAAIATATDGSVLYRDGSFTQSDSPSAIIGDEHAIATVTESDILKSYMDSIVDNLVANVVDDTISTIETLQIGSEDTLTGHVYGHITDFRVYDFALNDREVDFLSG